MARPKKFDHNVALTQMMHVFWQQGYDATSMRDLEQATQLSPSSLYNSFGNKQQLFNQTLTFYINQIIDDRVSQYLVHTEDALKGIHTFISTMFTKVPNKLTSRSCLLVNTASELGQSDLLIGNTIRQGLKHIEKALISAFTRAQQQGNILATTDCQLAAKQISLLLPGFLLAAKNGATPQSLTTLLDFSLQPFIKQK